MIRFFLAAVLLFSTPVLTAQPSVRGEFATESNGLMYSNADMKVLRFMVDSLNLRFKTCDLTKTFYSSPQGKPVYIYIKSEKNDLTDVINDIGQNISPDKLISKYKDFIDFVDSQQLVVRYSTARDTKERYSIGDPFNGHNTLYIDSGQQITKNGWIYNYTQKDKYSRRYSLECRYFENELKQIAIPEKYGRLIQYVDCMIDTNATIFLSDKYAGGLFGLRDDDNEKAYSDLGDLSTYINSKRQETSNGKVPKSLSESQVEFATKNLSTDTIFLGILSRTIDNYMEKKQPDYQLERLAKECGLYHKALQMKRSYIVMGYCSQDTRPREHARDIAVLAAQAHSWDIFLRSHLDIMNDRFERMVDGSYAYGDRKTYLKELEELNLNIVDLMLGLALRADNTAGNHYFGTIWRLGWALTESKEKQKFETEVLSMIKDAALDEYNRGILFLLYNSYLSHLDSKERKEKTDILRKNTGQFPSFIQLAIQRIKDPKKEK